MEYKSLDMEAYNRKSHFEYFSSLSYPYVGTTVNVEITNAFEKIKERRLPFFLTFCYLVSRAANSVVQFRQRIMDGGIIEFKDCITSHTVALEDETYCYCTLDSSMPFSDYLPYAVRAQESAKMQMGIKEEKEETLDKIFITTLPWISYTSLLQPVPMPADSNPRISWGGYFRQEEKVIMPVSVLCNHALVDGRHMARFYESLNEQILMF